MILVFGKTGQVARELQKYKGILSLDRLQANLAEPLSCANKIIQIKPSAVINAAAYTAVDMAENEPHLANLINCEAPRMIGKACFELNIPLVHISTDYVFDGTGNTAWSTFSEANPINEYGKSKLLGEEAIKSSGASYAIVRTSWVISAYANNFVNTMMRLSNENESISVVDDQIGGPTPASDIAEASIKIANQLINDPKKSGIYHYSGSPDTSWYKFAKVIFSQAGREVLIKPIPTSEYPTPATRPLNSRLDCRLTKSTFNIPRPDWVVGLKEILRQMEGTDDEA